MSDMTKIPYSVAKGIAEAFAENIRPYCLRVELAGSLRRETTHVGDIEIVAIPYRIVDLFGEEREEGPTELDRYLDGENHHFSSRGAKYQRINLMEAIGADPILVSVDLFLPTSRTWGSIFTIRTGGWEFSRWLVTSQLAGGAAPVGITFREGRVYKGGRLLSTPEEADVFAAVGLAFIPPKQRIGVPINPVHVEPVWQFAD